MTDTDSRGETIPKSTYHTALKLLVADGHVIAAQSDQAWKKAEKEQRHVGELLVLSGGVSAQHWADAVRRARLTEDLQRVPVRRSVSIWWIVAAAIVVAGILAIGLWSR